MALFHHFDNEAGFSIFFFDAAVVLAAFVGKSHAPVKTDCLVSDWKDGSRGVECLHLMR